MQCYLGIPKTLNSTFTVSKLPTMIGGGLWLMNLLHVSLELWVALKKHGIGLPLVLHALTLCRNMNTGTVSVYHC